MNKKGLMLIFSAVLMINFSAMVAVDADPVDVEQTDHATKVIENKLAARKNQIKVLARKAKAKSDRLKLERTQKNKERKQGGSRRRMRQGAQEKKMGTGRYIRSRNRRTSPTLGAKHRSSAVAGKRVPKKTKDKKSLITLKERRAQALSQKETAQDDPVQKRAMMRKRIRHERVNSQADEAQPSRSESIVTDESISSSEAASAIE